MHAAMRCVKASAFGSRLTITLWPACRHHTSKHMFTEGQRQAARCPTPTFQVKVVSLTLPSCSCNVSVPLAKVWPCRALTIQPRPSQGATRVEHCREPAAPSPFCIPEEVTLWAWAHSESRRRQSQLSSSESSHAACGAAASQPVLHSAEESRTASLVGSSALCHPHADRWA